MSYHTEQITEAESRTTRCGPAAPPAIGQNATIGFAGALPVATQIGEVHGLQIAKSMPDGRCGYEAQVDAYRETRSARAVVETLRDTLSA